MLARHLLSLAVLALVPSFASAQIVRFDTNVGEFDMMLNPTGDDNLQPLVDNMISYVDSNRYHSSVINRAPDDFVLQMGGFLTSMISNVTSPDIFTEVNKFDTVTVDANNNGNVDFDTSALTNIRGTVSLALAGGDPNSGSSSFFVNLVDNSFLDDQGFVPFAYIQDMTVIDRIMALEKTSLDSGLTFSDVPLTDQGNLVVINNVSVVGSISTLVGPLGPSAATNEFAASSAASSFSSSPVSSSLTAVSVPEPGTMLLLATGSLLIVGRRTRS